MRRALAPGSADTYHRDSELERYELAVREVLADYPAMTVADIAVLVDWRRSRRHLSDLVARLRPQYVAELLVDAPSLGSIRAGQLLAVGAIEVGSVAL